MRFNQIQKISWLTLVTSLYLVFPHLLFLWGWTRWWIAGPAIIILLSLLALYWRDRLPSKATPWTRTGLAQIGVALLCGLGWAALAGVGGFTYQNMDYAKHNGVFTDLLNQAWPVFISSPDVPNLPLVYYFGHYLTPALVGHWLGEFAGRMAWLIQAGLGISLILLWFARSARRYWPLAMFFFFGFSGLDIIGQYFTLGHFPALGEHLEWFAHWQLSANVTATFWVPQHFIAAGLIAFLYRQEMGRAADLRHFPLLTIIIPLWSPLVALGLIPFAIAAVIRLRGRALWSGQLMATLFGLFPIYWLYFTSLQASQYENHFLFPPFWEDYPKFFAQLILFLTLEIFIYFIPFLSKDLWKELCQERLVLIAVGFLLLLSVYKFGFYNDLFMRGSFVALIFVQIFLWRRLVFVIEARQWARLALFGLIWSVGVITPASEIYRTYTHRTERMPYLSSGYFFQIIPAVFAIQYFGNPQALFFQQVAPKK